MENLFGNYFLEESHFSCIKERFQNYCRDQNSSGSGKTFPGSIFLEIAGFVAG